MDFNYLNSILTIGNEAFEDLPETPVVRDVPEPTLPVPPVDPEAPVIPVVPEIIQTEPVVPEVPVVPVIPVDPIEAASINAAAAAVVDAEEDLALAQGANTLAVLDGELAAAETTISSANTAIAHIQEISAGIEHFLERGALSANTAHLLQQSISFVMTSVGKDGKAMMGGGLEAFSHDPDQMKIILAQGLEELEEEKKEAGGKAKNALKGALATIGKFVSEAFNQSKRLHGKIAKLGTEISGKPEKEVPLSSAALMVSKNYTTNLVGDLAKFKDKLVKASNQAITERGNWFFKTAPGVIASINSAETADAAVAAAAKLKAPSVKGATVSVSDGVKRTEVVLGNYAIFEMSSAPAAPTDTASAVEFLKASSSARISIQRAKTEAPEAETITMNEATARKVLTAAEAILTEAEALKSVVDGLSKQSLDVDGNGSDSDDKDVKKIASAASALPDGLVETVSQLPRTATRAAFDVVEAALGVVSAFAKGGAAKPEKEEKPEETPPKKDDAPEEDKGE